MSVKVDYAAVENARLQMVKHAKDMHGYLEELVRQLDSVQEGFTGAAATAFNDLRRTVQAKNSEMANTFNSGSIVLDNLAQNFSRADTTSAGLF
ncbi:WXG100 family type VII secretion target [Streptomyces sp. NPDC058548]|uniref:WXG100 family type VII secretion target n=1 Tax=unclassified Streptomyces TaxID=2593676 RepID=UPI00366545F1